MTKQEENVKLANVSFLDSVGFGSKNTEGIPNFKKANTFPSRKMELKEVKIQQASKDATIQMHHGNSPLHIEEFTHFAKPGSFTNCSNPQG